MVRSGKKLIGQANSQTLSDQMSCMVSATFVNTEKHSMLLGNTFQPVNIRLKPVCNRYERFAVSAITISKLCIFL